MRNSVSPFWFCGSILPSCLCHPDWYVMDVDAWCLMLMLDADAWCCDGGTVTRRSHTGILYIKNTPMTWDGNSWDLCALRLVCWFETCRVYLLVLWHEWWTIIYEFSYDTGIPIGTCQWILWISCQQHHHGKIRIRNKNRLFLLFNSM